MLVNTPWSANIIYHSSLLLGTFGALFWPSATLATARAECDHFIYLFCSMNIMSIITAFCVCLLHFVISENVILPLQSSAVTLVWLAAPETTLSGPWLKKFVHHCIDIVKKLLQLFTQLKRVVVESKLALCKSWVWVRFVVILHKNLRHVSCLLLRSWCSTDQGARLKKVKAVYSSSWETYLRATERHLPYRITQCYLPPSTSECVPP